MMPARLLLAVLLTLVIAACAAKLPPPPVGPPQHPEFMFPTLTTPDPRLADSVMLHQAGWQFLQAGDLDRAVRDFQAALKRAPAFYPSDAALGDVELARGNYPQALEHFDRVLAERVAYLSALLGRGQALLALSRDAEALVAFEAALAVDSTLADVAQRVEVLRARAAQDNVAAARQAAQAGRLDEAGRAYEQAIATSPESGFLFRDLADIEAKQGKTEQALQHYRKSIELDPADVSSRFHIAEMLDASGDLAGAIAMYTEAYGLEPTPQIRQRIAALEERAAYLRLPAEYRALPGQPSITRGDLAALMGIRLEPLLTAAPEQLALVTDTQDHWAALWIMSVVRAGVMDAYENHTFQPLTQIQRADLAQAVSRVLKLIAASQPALLKEWQGRQARMTDVGVSNLNYADASLAVSSGILSLSEGGAFQLARPVSGDEAIDAVTKLDRLYNSSK